MQGRETANGKWAICNRQKANISRLFIYNPGQKIEERLRALINRARMLNGASQQLINQGYEPGKKKQIRNVKLRPTGWRRLETRFPLSLPSL